MPNDPRRPPRSDAEWAREVNRRLRALESPRSVRVGPWVLSSRDGELVATRPGQLLDVGSEPVEPVVLDLTRGFVTASQVETAVAGETDKAGPLKAAGNFLSDKWSDLLETIHGAIRSNQGIDQPEEGTVWDGIRAALSFADQASTVSGLSEAIQRIRADLAAIGGTSAMVDFTSRANASSLGSDFTQFYTGPGSSTFGITNGRAADQIAFGSERQCIALYNVTNTSTDNQQVGASYTSGNQVWNPDRSKDACDILVARSNTALTTYVFVELFAERLVMGCYVGGTRYVFFTDNTFRFKSGSGYWLIPGTSSGARTFQVWQGTTPLMLHTGGGDTITYSDSAAISQYGGSYRYGGLGIRDMASGVIHIKPGAASGFVVADRTP